MKVPLLAEPPGPVQVPPGDGEPPKDDPTYARGYQQFGFKEYDTGRQGSWMVQLTDTPATNESQN